MSKYTIVSKSSRGNVPHTTCTVVYQVEGHYATEYKIDLYCRGEVEGKMSYCFLEGYDGMYIDTNADREEFLEEFYKFQKGNCYRVSHPIIKSSLRVLEDKQRNLKEQLEIVEKEIKDEKEKAKREKFKHYSDDIDDVSLNEFIEALSNLLNINSRYYLQPILHIWDGYKFFIIDKILDKPVKVGIFNKDGIEFRNVELYEI